MSIGMNDDFNLGGRSAFAPVAGSDAVSRSHRAGLGSSVRPILPTDQIRRHVVHSLATLGVVKPTSEGKGIQPAPMSDLIDQEFLDEGALGASGGPHRSGASGVELDILVVWAVEGSEFESPTGNPGAAAAS
jgi:hypothetical protein